MTNWWIIDSNGHLLPKGKIVFMELYENGDNGLRKFIVDGQGNLWFPSTESPSKRVPHSIGKLLTICKPMSDAQTKALAELFGFAGREIIMFPANKKVNGLL